MKKSSNIKVFYTVLILCIYLYGNSQDVHFSQYYNFPLFTNPANTGDIKGTVRAVAVYRTQWSSVAIPYTTTGCSFEGNLYRNRYKTRSLGAGILVLSDKVGEYDLKTNIVMLSVAGNVRISYRNFLAVGMQGGFGQKRFDPSKLQWGNQYNGLSHDPNLSSGERYYYNNLIYNDLSTGINWTYDGNTGREGIYSRSAYKPKANLGVAMYHLNRPNTTLNDPFKKEKLYRKITVNGSLTITGKLSNVSIIPSFLCEFQGSSTKVNVGGMVRYLLKEGTMYTGLTDGKAFSIGGFYRVKDAFVISTLYEFQQIAFGISYDVNISKLVVATSARGGIEFSLRYMNPQPLRYTQHRKQRRIRAKF